MLMFPAAELTVLRRGPGAVEILDRSCPGRGEVEIISEKPGQVISGVPAGGVSKVGRLVPGVEGVSPVPGMCRIGGGAVSLDRVRGHLQRLINGHVLGDHRILNIGRVAVSFAKGRNVFGIAVIVEFSDADEVDAGQIYDWFVAQRRV